MSSSKTKSETPQPNVSIPACYADTAGVITTTTNTLPNHRITRHLGSVFGITVRARNWGADIGGLLKSSVGGELGVFTNLMYKARNEAMDRMVGECLARGGNAILGMRFDVASNGPWTQVCAYGTAVRVEVGAGGEEEEEDV